MNPGWPSTILNSALTALWSIGKAKLLSLAVMALLFGLVDGANGALACFGMQASLMAMFLSAASGAIATLGGASVVAFSIRKATLDGFEKEFPKLLSLVLLSGLASSLCAIVTWATLDFLPTTSSAVGLGGLLSLLLRNPGYAFGAISGRSPETDWRVPAPPSALALMTIIPTLCVPLAGWSLLTLAALWLLGAVGYGLYARTAL